MCVRVRACVRTCVRAEKPLPLSHHSIWTELYVTELCFECFSASSQASGILTSQLKPANGLVTGAGLEIGTPPLGTPGQLSTQDLGLFINQHVGYAQPVSATAGQNLQIIKREPEDLSHHRRLESTSPDLDNPTIITDRQRHKVHSQSITQNHSHPVPSVPPESIPETITFLSLGRFGHHLLDLQWYTIVQWFFFPVLSDVRFLISSVVSV